MELIKLENMRDEWKRAIDNISKELYDTKDKMEDILIEADYWSPWLRGQLLTFIEILEFKTSQKNDMQKLLDSVLKKIEEHPETKFANLANVAKALGFERTECDCEMCKGSRAFAEKIIEETRLKADLESQEKEEEAEPEPKKKFAVNVYQMKGIHVRLFDDLIDASIFGREQLGKPEIYKVVVEKA